MGNWRRQRGKNNHREIQGTRTRSQNWKPPLGNWKPTVPSWEKKFCSSVCYIPWGKVLEAKRFMHLFENVTRWNDSAGEEAFKNAKSRFWAQINNLPCEISLPDPDIYIDEIDWDSEIDPQLLLDLECDLGVHEAKDQNVVTFDNPLLPSHLMGVGYGTGWGDLDEEKVDSNKNETEKNIEQCDWDVGEQENSWEPNYESRNDPVKSRCKMEKNTKQCDWNVGEQENSWEPNYESRNDPVKNRYTMENNTKQCDWNVGEQENSWEPNYGSTNDFLKNQYRMENKTEQCDWNVDEEENSWERNYESGNDSVKNRYKMEKNAKQCDWSVGEQENSWEPNYESRNDSLKNQNNFWCKNPGGYADGGDWGRSDWKWNKREGFDGNAQRCTKTSDFQQADHTVDCGWRNEQGRKRRNFRTNDRYWTESC